MKLWRLHEKQHSYRKGRSLETALLFLAFIEDHIGHTGVCVGAFLASIIRQVFGEVQRNMAFLGVSKT